MAIIANLLVLPFVPLAMLLTFFAGIGALLIPSLASWFGAPAFWLLDYMISVAKYLAGLPWAQTQLTINDWVMAGSYALIILICGYMAWRAKYNLRNVNIVE